MNLGEEERSLVRTEVLNKEVGNIKMKVEGVLAKMEAWAETLHFLANQKKDNNQFKNKEQLELPENHLHGNPTTKELKKYSSRLVCQGEIWPKWKNRSKLQKKN